MDLLRLTGALVRLAVLTYLLGLLDRSSAKANECHRWNCPCAGASKREHRQSKRNSSLLSTSHGTRARTQELLRKMVDTRFHRNMQHINSLETCVENGDANCYNRHLNRECTMESLPTLEAIHPDALNIDNLNTPEALRNARMWLSTLAVYVDQARKDEEARKGDPSNNLAADIRLIEEMGIYHLLCNLHSTYYINNMAWEPAYESDLVDPGCRSLSSMAPTDNRNYITFFTLDKLLHGLSNHFDNLDSRRKKWRHALRYGFRYER